MSLVFVSVCMFVSKGEGVGNFGKSKEKPHQDFAAAAAAAYSAVKALLS